MDAILDLLREREMLHGPNLLPDAVRPRQALSLG
jgi:hypothetical protein